jgi:hypothetical protein
VLAIIGALVAFLFEGWNETTGLYKLSVFAGFLTTLFISGEAIKFFKLDVKTSLMQVLYMLGLTTFTTHIGSIIYANHFGVVDNLPSLLQIDPIAGGEGIILGFSAFLTLLGGAALKRMKLPLLDISFISIINLLILLPVRTGSLGISLVSLSIISIGLFIKKSELEGKQLVLVFFPGLILVTRSMLHLSGHSFFAFLGALIFGTLFYVLPSLIDNRETKVALQFASVIGILTFWFNISYAFILEDYSVTLIASFATLHFLAPYSEDKGRSFRVISAIPLILLFLKASFIQFTAFNISMTIALSLYLLTDSFKHKITYTLFSGIGCFAGMVLAATIKVVPWGGVDTWILLAGSGLIIVVGSFVIEKNMELIKEKWSDLDGGFEDWG